jgi:hypothetical protein
MKRGLIFLVLIGVLALSTGGLLVLHFQDASTIRQTGAQIATVNDTVTALAKEMASMRGLVPGAALGNQRDRCSGFGKSSSCTY